MKPSEWADVVSVWAQVWPNQPLPPESFEVWYELLADLSGDVVRAGLLAWAGDRDRTWPPRSPGELRDACLPPAADWTEAITALATAVRRNGRYTGKPDDLGPELDAYIDSVGGWTRLCDTFDPSNPSQRAQFRDSYGTLTRRVRRDEARELAGGILPALGAGA